MKRCILAWTVLLLTFALWADSPSGTNVLQDQFGHKTLVRIGEGRGALILISDRRDAAELVELWVHSLAPLPDSVDPWFIADLKALPFFIPHIAITNWLVRLHPLNPILIDWNGEFSKGLAPAKNDVTAFVFDADGSLLGRASGRLTADKIAQLRGSLEKAGELRASPQSSKP